ncbi:MAG: glycine cleavage system protein H [Candidatus Helarchaeota archaeon]
MVKVGDYELPDDLNYHEKHTWAKKDGDLVIVGVDSIGVALAGKIIFVRLKKVGKSINAGKNFGTAEAGKGVIPLTAPITGEIVETNPNVSGRKVKDLNDDPYGAGWLIKLKPTGDLEAEMSKLITGDAIKVWAEEEIKQL